MMVTIMMRTTTLVGGSKVELSPDKDRGNDEEEDNDNDHDHDHGNEEEDHDDEDYEDDHSSCLVLRSNCHQIRIARLTAFPLVNPAF